MRGVLQDTRAHHRARDAQVEVTGAAPTLTAAGWGGGSQQGRHRFHTSWGGGGVVRNAAVSFALTPHIGSRPARAFMLPLT